MGHSNIYAALNFPSYLQRATNKALETTPESFLKRRQRRASALSLGQKMVRLTFDTNCIIDLEEQRPDSKYLREIIDAWRNNKVEISVVAVSASENQPQGQVSETYKQFEKKIEAVGLKGAVELLPLAYWGVFYWDHALWSNDKMEDLQEKIRNVLFPGIQPEAPKSDKEARVWRNKLCDVLVAWSHAYHQCDVLVTRDHNFHKKKEGLSQLGVKHVMYPSEAVELCRP